MTAFLNGLVVGIAFATARWLRKSRGMPNGLDEQITDGVSTAMAKTTLLLPVALTVWCLFAAGILHGPIITYGWTGIAMATMIGNTLERLSAPYQ